MSFVGKTFAKLTGADKAMEGQQMATNAMMASEREALDHLKETNRIPQKYKELGLTAQAQLAGLEGDPMEKQQQLIEQAKASPLFGAIMGGLEAGEESILSNAAATGGLRSGNAIGALSEFAANLENKALLDSYNQQLSGIQGLAGLNTNQNNAMIANSMSKLGNIAGQGHLAQGQMQQQNMQNLFQTGFGALKMLASGGF